MAATWDRLRKAQRWLEGRLPRSAARQGGGESSGEAGALRGLQTGTPRQRWESAAILARNPQRSREAVAVLVTALADPEPFVRWQAAEALAAQEPNRVFQVLVATLQDPEPLRRAGAAEALGCSGGEAAGTILRNLTADPDGRVRAAILRSLGQCADPASIPAVLPLLDDPDPDVRRAAARCLGQIGDPKTATALADRLGDRRQPLLVRRSLVAALVHAAHPSAQPILLEALADPDPQVRAYAAEALGQVGDEGAHAALTGLLADRTPLLRGTVADVARSALALLERRGRRSLVPSALKIPTPASHKDTKTLT